MLIIKFVVKLYYIASAIYIFGKTSVPCGNTARFLAEITLEKEVYLPVSWDRVEKLVRTQIDIEDEKYRGSDSRQLIIHNVCKEDEGRYQAVISRNHDVKIFSNELYLHPTGGIQPFWKFLLPETCFVPFFYFPFFRG